jgi:glucose-1-phosphate cytidylyltransferase
MKCVILAGGLGSRLSEETHRIPKPLVKIGKNPIIMHIISIYKHYNCNNFLICGGYKFLEFYKFFKKNNHFKIVKKKKNYFKFVSGKITIEIIFTGLNTNTAGRLLRVKKYLVNDQNFCATYGDGVANINIGKLIKFHIKKKNIATLTSVKPPARFGALTIKNDKVIKFQEKMDNTNAWINGGFFVFNNKIFNIIKKNEDSLEHNIMTKLSRSKQLNAFKHKSFWKPMDTLRDKLILNKMWKSGKAPWKI